jgi:hypothetical protein
MTIRVCRICAAPIPYRPNGRGRGRPRVVHPECEPENNRRRAAKWRAAGPQKPLCTWCGLVPVPFGGGWSRYCSPGCAEAGANARRRENRAEPILNTNQEA